MFPPGWVSACGAPRGLPGGVSPKCAPWGVSAWAGGLCQPFGVVARRGSVPKTIGVTATERRGSELPVGPCYADVEFLACSISLLSLEYLHSEPFSSQWVS